MTTSDAQECVTKVCSKCGKEKTEAEFYKRNDRSNTGLSSRCKSCYAEAYKQKKDNPDFIKYNREKSKKYYDENKVRCLDWHKKNRSANHEKIKRQQSDYRSRNKLSISLRNKQYRDRNKEKISRQRACYRKTDRYKSLQKHKREYMRMHSSKYYYRNRHKTLHKLRIETEFLSDSHVVKIICQRKSIDRRLVTIDIIKSKRTQLMINRAIKQQKQILKEISNAK